MDPEPKPDETSIYQFRIEGQLDKEWTDWFEGLSLTPLDEGQTLLTGVVIDQAALYGLLKRLRDLGLPLISVVRLERGPNAHPSNGTALS